MLHEMGKMLPKAAAISVNSFEELDPSLTNDLPSKLENLLAIGPLNLVSDQDRKPKPAADEFSCIPWLDGQKPQSVAYICFGTIATPPPHELLALAEALEETETPFLWSIKDDSKKHFPRGFAEETKAGKVVGWAPQAEVLQHRAVGAFVTHGGFNSVLESIGAGVPMICRPFFGDQLLNAWMVEKVYGIGVRTKDKDGGFTKPETCRLLQHVLKSDDSSQKIKARILALKELAHKAVGPNGSSTQNFHTLLKIVSSETL